MQLQKVPKTSQRTREYVFSSGTGENKPEKNTSAYGAHSSSSIDKTIGQKMVGSKSSNTSGAVRTKSPGMKTSPGGVAKKSIGAGNYASTGGGKSGSTKRTDTSARKEPKDQKSVNEVIQHSLRMLKEGIMKRKNAQLMPDSRNTKRCITKA